MTPQTTHTGRPLVTAGMAIYNSAKTVARALDSLLAQKYSNLEIVICEDGSTDESYDICKKYAAENSQIRLYRNEKNIGFERNYRQVVHKAEGKYYFWADGDDIHHPEYVQLLVEALEGHADAAVAQGAMERRYDDGEYVDIKRLPTDHDPTQMGPVRRSRYFLTTKSDLRSLKHNYFQMGLWRRKALLPILESYPWELGERPLLAAIALEHGFVYVNEVLVTVHLHRKTALERFPDVPSLQQGALLGIVEHRRAVWDYLYSLPHLPKRVKLFRIPLLFAWVATERKMRREIKKHLLRKAARLFSR